MSSCRMGCLDPCRSLNSIFSKPICSSNDSHSLFSAITSLSETHAPPIETFTFCKIRYKKLVWAMLAFRIASFAPAADHSMLKRSKLMRIRKYCQHPLTTTLRGQCELYTSLYGEILPFFWAFHFYLSQYFQEPFCLCVHLTVHKHLRLSTGIQKQKLVGVSHFQIENRQMVV